MPARTNRQCQSCGMPLHTDRAGDCRGTEADGSRSETWCSLCYADGTFVKPDCTLPEMLAIVDTALRENGSGRIMRWLAARQVPTLERWRKA
ncbi:MAG: zinc ribbon domain-containing protein [Actinomycetota bacterium]